MDNAVQLVQLLRQLSQNKRKGVISEAQHRHAKDILLAGQQERLVQQDSGGAASAASAAAVAGGPRLQRSSSAGGRVENNDELPIAPYLRQLSLASREGIIDAADKNRIKDLLLSRNESQVMVAASELRQLKRSPPGGIHLPEMDAEEKQMTWICAHCNFENEQRDRSCGICGSSSSGARREDRRPTQAAAGGAAARPSGVSLAISRNMEVSSSVENTKPRASPPEKVNRRTAAPNKRLVARAAREATPRGSRKTSGRKSRPSPSATTRSSSRIGNSSLRRRRPSGSRNSSRVGSASSSRASSRDPSPTAFVRKASRSRANRSNAGASRSLAASAAPPAAAAAAAGAGNDLSDSDEDPLSREVVVKPRLIHRQESTEGLHPLVKIGGNATVLALLFLEPVDIAAFTQVSRYCNEVCQSTHLWRGLYQLHCKRANRDMPTHGARHPWKQLYIEAAMEDNKWDQKRSLAGSFNIRVMVRFKPLPHDYEERVAEEKRQLELLELEEQEARAALASGAAGGSQWKRERAFLALEQQREERLKQVKISKSRGKITSLKAQSVHTKIPTLGKRVFRFDAVFGPDAAQEQVYSELRSRTLGTFMNGFDVTLFVYGQTGSGKTHTMTGPPSVVANLIEGNAGIDEHSADPDMGVIPRVFQSIFTRIEQEQYNNAQRDISVEYSLSMQMVEIYRERMTCLFSGGPVDAVGNGGGGGGGGGSQGGNGFAHTGQSILVENLADVMRALRDAEQRKRVFATAMNERSSRSHSLLTLRLVQKNTSKDITLDNFFHLVDLAGSERVKKSKASGDRLEEAKSINLSLTTLGRCIQALADKGSQKGKRKSRIHVPYRDSCLTMLLAASLGGNCKTTMICCAASDPLHWDETVSTLRFGERTASVKNNIVAKKKSSAALLEDLKATLRSAEAVMIYMERRNRTGLPEYAAQVHTVRSLRKQVWVKSLVQDIKTRRLPILPSEEKSDDESGSFTISFPSRVFDGLVADVFCGGRLAHPRGTLCQRLIPSDAELRILMDSGVSAREWLHRFGSMGKLMAFFGSSFDPLVTELINRGAIKSALVPLQSMTVYFNALDRRARAGPMKGMLTLEFTYGSA